MLIERVVGSTHLAVDSKSGNSIYLDKHTAQELGSNSSNANAVLKYIYKANNSGKRLPLVCMWELTNACDFNCPFCFIHNCHQAVFQNSEETIRLIDAMVDAGLLLCTLTGGEVLLHPEFEKIYSYMKNKGVLVEVYSNLSLLTESQIELFRQLQPYKVEVTLYGHDNPSYCSNTAQMRYDFDHVFRNVKRLQQAGINVICKTTATVDTYSSIAPLCNLCDAENLPYYFSFSMHPDYTGRAQSSYEVPLPIKEKLLLKRVHRNGHFVDEVDKRKSAFYCAGSKYGCYISYDLKMRLCHQAYRVQNSSISIGNACDVERALAFLDDFVAPYLDRKLTHCEGCRASQYCKVCGLDEMVAIQASNQENVMFKCAEYKTLYSYVKAQYDE